MERREAPRNPGTLPRIARARCARSMRAYQLPRRQSVALQRDPDLVEDGWIVDRRRQVPVIAVGDLLHGAAQDLARPRLGQTDDRDGELERRHRPDPLAQDRKSTRLNSSHMSISYAVFCLKKK